MDGDDERRYIVGIIQDGAKSDYWKLLKQSISEWIAEENKRLDSYKDSAISEKDIEKYNRAVDRVRYLKRMLAMNETIINHHRSFLDRIKDEVVSVFQKGESFFEEVTKR